MSENRNKWEKELAVFGQLNSAIVLTGDIYDIVPYYSGNRIAALYTLGQYLCRYFRASAIWERQRTGRIVLFRSFRS